MQLKQKQCKCCGAIHSSTETLTNVIDLEQFYNERGTINPFKKVATIQADCKCGSTLYFNEIKENEQ